MTLILHTEKVRTKFFILPFFEFFFVCYYLY